MRSEEKKLFLRCFISLLDLQAQVVSTVVVGGKKTSEAIWRMNKSRRWRDTKEEVFALKFNLIDKFSSVFFSLSLSLVHAYTWMFRELYLSTVKKQIYFHKNDDSQEGHVEEITGERRRSGSVNLFLSFQFGTHFEYQKIFSTSLWSSKYSHCPLTTSSS